MGSAISIRPSLKRRNHVALDLTTLEAIPDDHLEQTVRAYVSFQIANSPGERETLIADLPPGFRAIVTTLEVEREVNNGGFQQYFWNTEAQLAAPAEEGFRRIGAPMFADLVIRAHAIWEKERPIRESLKQRNLLEWFSECCKSTKLRDLDHEFYELADECDLSLMRVAYIRAHPMEFVTR